MAGRTPHLNLAYFDYGDVLDSPLNVEREIERFIVIDKQLYGYAKIFGNGVIEGWDISAGNNLSVTITSGVGLISGIAVESFFPSTLGPLPSNSLLYIYVDRTRSSVRDRSANFFYSRTQQSGDVILLATVSTGGIGIQSVDNSVRKLIGFRDMISEIVSQHRHNGISAPKIDLDTETQGLLPSSKMDEVDASKVKGGKLDKSVLPTISHSELEDIGSLSHAQLDSFIKTLPGDNTALLGEIETINALRRIIYHKQNTDADYDATFVNEFAVIPGIDGDRFIDFENSTANINISEGCVSGIPASLLAGEYDPADPYSTDEYGLQVRSATFGPSDFKDAPTKINLNIDESGARLSSNASSDRIVETFDSGTNGELIPSFSSVLEHEYEDADIRFSDTSAQGPLAALMTINDVRIARFSRDFDAPEDWSTFDKIEMYIRTFGATPHSGLYFIIYDGEGEELYRHTLVPSTTSTEVSDNAGLAFFERFEVPINTLDRNRISGFAIETGELNRNFQQFAVDAMYLRSDEFVQPQGTLRLRYETSGYVVFDNVEYISTTPGASELRMQVRVANSLEELSEKPFSPILSSSETFALSGRVIEIQFTFISTPDRSATPNLEGVVLNWLAPSSVSGLSLSSADLFSRGENRNTIVIEDPVGGDNVLMERINVGNFYFINDGVANELDPDRVPVSAVRGDLLPITPIQAMATVLSEDGNVLASEITPRGLNNPKSIFRLIDGSFLISDTDNDRIIEVTADGKFVRGYASHNGLPDDLLPEDSGPIALTSNYNPRLGRLYITFSFDFDITAVNLRNVNIIIGAGTVLSLSNDTDRPMTLLGSLFGDYNPSTEVWEPPSGENAALIDNVITVQLSPEKQSLLNATNDAVQIEVNGNPFAIECFKGDYMYFGRFGIQNPIDAKRTDRNTIVVANAQVTSVSDTLLSGFPFLEFDLATGTPFQDSVLGTYFGYAGLAFSDIVLGSAHPYTIENSLGETERRVLVAGLSVPTVGENQGSDGTSGSNLSGTGLFSGTFGSGNPADPKGVNGGVELGSTDEEKLANFVGRVIVMNPDNGIVTYRYTCPDGLFPSDATLDKDGNIVVAETGIGDVTGRIVTLDDQGNVIRLVGDGLFSRVNDVRVLEGNNLFVST